MEILFVQQLRLQSKMQRPTGVSTGLDIVKGTHGGWFLAWAKEVVPDGNGLGTACTYCCGQRVANDPASTSHRAACKHPSNPL